MALIHDIMQLVLICIVAIYMATCMVGFPLACIAAWHRARQRARDIEYSQTYLIERQVRSLP
jgi:hypothetical protein